jgi:hypothetical protein
VVVAAGAAPAGRRRQAPILPPQVRRGEYPPFPVVFATGQRSGKEVISVTIDSPPDNSNVPSIFNVSGTVDTSKEVPTMSGQAVSGGITVNGTVTKAPTLTDDTYTIKFDTTQYAGQGLKWTVTISATYSDHTDKLQVHVGTP